MKITPEARAFAIEQAGRRCECTGTNCRHHLRGSRCKRGLRGDDWKIYWRSEDGGISRENIEAWCPECFGNNFVPPREMVALLALDIVGYKSLLEENQRTASTLKSVLRDVAKRCAAECGGRVVFDRLDDDILAEFSKSSDAIKAAKGLGSSFEELVGRLDLPIIGLCGALHRGEVARWRNGILAGDAVEIATTVRNLAGAGQLVLTDPAAAPLKGGVDLEPFADAGEPELPPVGGLWAMRL